MTTVQTYFTNKVIISNLTKTNKELLPLVVKEALALIKANKEFLEKANGGVAISKRVLAQYTKQNTIKAIDGLTNNQLALFNVVLDCLELNITIDYDSATVSSLKRLVKEKRGVVAITK